jgi:exodeoxyribonuclease VII small subunit
MVDPEGRISFALSVECRAFPKLKSEQIPKLHMATKQAAAKSGEPTFESAIERLEKIVEEMESDKLPLEDLLIRYEEGTKLVKVCESRLQSAEKRIEIITRNAEGDIRLEEFEPEKKSSAPPTNEEVSLF